MPSRRVLRDDLDLEGLANAGLDSKPIVDQELDRRAGSERLAAQLDPRIGRAAQHRSALDELQGQGPALIRRRPERPTERQEERPGEARAIGQLGDRGRAHERDRPGLVARVMEREAGRDAQGELDRIVAGIEGPVFVELDRLAVDEGAGARAEVAQHERAFDHPQLGVLARERDPVDRHFAVGRATDPEPLAADHADPRHAELATNDHPELALARGLALELVERGDQGRAGLSAGLRGAAKVIVEPRARPGTAAERERHLDLALELDQLALGVLALVELLMDRLEPIDLARVGVGPRRANQEPEPLVEPARFTAALSGFERLGGLEHQRALAGPGLEPLGDAQQRLPERAMQGLALVAAGRVASTALAQDREPLLLVAQGLGVLEPEARGLGVLADVLEQARGLLQLAGLLERERGPKLRALVRAARRVRITAIVIAARRAGHPSEGSRRVAGLGVRRTPNETGRACATQRPCAPAPWIGLAAAICSRLMPRALLEPVAAGQTRFRMQGLAPDARGIAVGREALIVFESLDRLVAFLGAFSSEASLDDLLPSMTLERARREAGSGALLLRCEASDGYALDRLARLAGATRSQLYVGSGSVFVRSRDAQAPFGHDLALPLGTILAETKPNAPRDSDSAQQAGLASDEVLVVDHEFSSRLRASDRIDPVELIQRLALRRIPLPLQGLASDPECAGLRDMALVLVAPGVADRVLAYLWRKEVAMAGVRVTLGDDRRASLLLRLRQPPARVLDVLMPIPGVELLAPVSPRAAIEVGYEHPINLAAASTCLPGDEMYLFRGRVGRVERIDGAPRFVDGRYLVASEVRMREIDPEAVAVLEASRLRVDLRLRASVSQAREPRATLVDWSAIETLRRIVYLVPPSALAAARLVPLLEGLLVLGGARLGRGISVGALIPLGQRLVEVAPGVLVPDGHELWPRVRPQLIRELLRLEGEDQALFLAADRPPIHIPAAAMLPLDAAAIGTLTTAEPTLVEPESASLQPGTLVNQKLGRFALWGFRSQES